MAQIVAPARNPLVPVPLMPSAAMQQRRGVVAPNPGASQAAQAPLAPTAQPAATMAPMAHAMGQYQETGSPWTAAAQGWVNASHAREESAAEQAKLDQVSGALQSHPDLARFVGSGVMDPADAIRLAGERDKLAADTQASESRKAKILEYLGQTDPDLAEAFAAGAIDEDGIYSTIQKRESGGEGSTFSQTPVFLVDPDGNQHAAQMSSTGGILVNGELRPGVPEGWQVVARPENLRPVSAGDRQMVFNPNTGQWEDGPTMQGAPSANQNVTIGPDGRSMAPAPGSPEAVEMEEAAAKAQMRRELQATYADIVTEDIDRVIDRVESDPMWTTGLGAAATQNVPGTPAFNTKQLADTIRANVGFDRLQQMREASPTGGALGQVSNFENTLLQATLGNLELSQDQPQLLRNLERVKEVYRKIVLEGIDPDDPLAQEIMGDEAEAPETAEREGQAPAANRRELDGKVYEQDEDGQWWEIDG